VRLNLEYRAIAAFGAVKARCSQVLRQPPGPVPLADRELIAGELLMRAGRQLPFDRPQQFLEQGGPPREEDEAVARELVVGVA
jgi:hypothetical protein